MNTEHHHTFGELFKVFRLRSGIETLALFGNLMAEQGLIYENSLFSRWQRNERVPRDRKTLLAVIHICAEKGGITSTEEANLLLASADQRELTADEEMALDLVSRPSSSIDLNTQPATQPGPTLSFKQMLGLLFKSRVSYLIVALFVVQTFIFYAIWTENLYGTNEAYIGGWTYGFIALVGIYFGLSNINKNQHQKTSTSTTIQFLCYGLLSQVIGLQVWFYYNLRGIEVPYPSLADFGYFGLIPFYALVALNVTNTNIVERISIFLKKKGVLVFLPIALTTLGLLGMFTYGGQIDLNKFITPLLDVLFPICETIPITILVYAMVFKMRNTTPFARTSATVVLVGFLLQFASEYTFIFSTRLNLYVTTGLIDYIYCISYTYMALVIVMFTRVNLLTYANQKLASSPTSKKHSAILHMQDAYLHTENLS